MKEKVKNEAPLKMVLSKECLVCKTISYLQEGRKFY